CTRVWDYFDYW
nr:immunoglobulin heavy chain junction region [Mus musculus]MBK4184406.1 immunoglobulin heavy chain junction region [Mus musculus]MBK4184408.1 immunoglobulin heavy chain junction region [Mus musculus]MBK4184409.1 immunoglobulin heavy chain junction region [Mus musculus]